MFIDIHSHLDICKNINLLIKNSKLKNVKIIVSAGTNPDSNKKTLEISKRYKIVKPCLGIYPTDCLKLKNSEINNEIKFIENHKSKIIGIGEVGIDLKENQLSTLKKQKQNLEKFVRLAKKLNKPLIIHSRNAEKYCVDFLKKFNYNKIIMHCFSGKKELIKRIIQNHWYLSVPTIVTYSLHFQFLVKISPLENLFCETDSPFLHPKKEFPNSPEKVIESYKAIACLKNISINKVEKLIKLNYDKLFK